MRDVTDPMNFFNKSTIPTHSTCPTCGHLTRIMRTIQSGRDTVNIYRCTNCKKEFVEEELKRK